MCALLERWPTLEELQKVPPAKLRTFFRKHHCRDQEVIERRLVGIRQAIPAIRDRAVIEAKSAVVKVIAQLIRSSRRKALQSLDRKIEEAAAAHPDFFIFDSLPGAGPVMAPRLLAAFGSQRERYGSAQEVQTVQWDRAGDGKEREKEVGTFSLGLSEVSAAELSRVGRALDCALAVGASLLPAAAATWQGAPRGGAGIGLQMDSHRISLLEDRAVYDESRYLMTLAKRNSPLAAVPGGTML